MKIITLNTWGGIAGGDILDFFKQYQDVDVFLLQEMLHKATNKTAWEINHRRELFQEIQQSLSGHTGHFAPAESNEWGLAIFVKETIAIQEVGDIFVHLNRDSMVDKDPLTVGKNLQYVKILDNNKELTIANFHGLWNGQGKTDTEDRLNQSKRIIEFIKTLSGSVILCGDFNLRPDTQSLQMIEQELGLVNLITKHGVISTRTSYYQKPEKFADYIFVSPNIEVKNFNVLPEEISDHAALYLEI